VEERTSQSASVAIVSAFALADLPRLIEQLHRLPKTLGLYVGSYGINGHAAAQVHGLPGGRYAPMFTVPYPDQWGARELAAVAVPRDQRPPFRIVVDAVTKLSPAERVHIGTELGRRQRDEIEAARAEGVAIETWQFDEIHGECAGAAGAPMREFTAAILRGLAGGGPGAAHASLTGIVWMARGAMALITERSDGNATFWRSVGGASRFLVGEEYPSFSLGVAQAVARYGGGRKALAGSTGERRALAPRYVVGVTPGWRIGPNLGLGGKTPGQSRDEVNKWRDAYLRERRLDGPAGFAVFDWTAENAAEAVVHDTVSALARVLG
jgi:hypothetical protein